VSTAQTHSQPAVVTPPGARRASTYARRSAWPTPGWLLAATATVLVVYALDNLFGVLLPGGVSEFFQHYASTAVFFGAAGQCALRARATPVERPAWWLFSLALVLWGSASLYYGAILWHDSTPPIPSPADGLWILFYGPAYAALYKLLRSKAGSARRTLGLDAVISALGAGGAIAAMTLPSILAQSHQTTLAFVTDAAYPLGDFGLLALVAAAITVFGLKASGTWRLIALAFTIFAINDSVYLVHVAQGGTYDSGGVFDLGWPVAALLLGVAAWRGRDVPPPDAAAKTTGVLPASAGLVALALLIYGQFSPLHLVALLLAVGTIIAVLLRFHQSARDNTRLVGVLSEDVAERRRVAEVLTRSEVRLRKAEEMVGGGSWEISLDGQTMTWSDGFLLMHGLQPGDGLDRESYLASVHPEDRRRVLDAVAECLRSGQAAAEYRVTRPDGVQRTVRAEGEIVEPDGEERYLRGGVLDVTDERAGFDAAAIGMLVAGPENLELRRVNDALCSMLGRERDQLLGMRIEELTHPDDRASAAANYRLLVAGATTSYEAEKRYLHPDGDVVWAEIHVTPVYDSDGSLLAFSSQVIDITDRKRSLAETESARMESLRRLAITSEYRDNETHEHTERVGRMAEQIGRAFGFAGPQLALLRHAAPLHDIGKIGVADAILLKPGRLTANEREAMEAHTLIGADILSESDSDVLKMAEQIAVAHHEKWDGTGYPHGLRGEAIPLVGRVVAIADVFDALTHARPYKEAWSVGRAVAHICGESGSHFDPELVNVFKNLDHAGMASCERDNELEANVGDPRWAAKPVRARARPTPETDDCVDRADAAAHRDQMASERDHAAAERDDVAAVADDGNLLRDDAAADRDHARHARDDEARKRDQSEARADGDTEARDEAASDRDHAASTRDRAASERELTEAHADPVAQPALRTSNRHQAAQDRGLADADRSHTAFDRDETHKEADDRDFNRADAAGDRQKAVADRAITADDRKRSEEEAGQRSVDRADAATDRVFASTDRDKAAADRVASMIELDESRNELRRAQVDQPTGAMSRQAGIPALHRAVERAHRDGGALTIAHIRVRGLEQVNELEGHPTGDALLREVVGAMQSELHGDDPIVRLSGDHFLCALQGSDARDARRRFAAVEKTIELYHHGASTDVRLAVLRSGDKLRELAHRADAGLSTEARVGA
jgi:PAS domain S-box-containing protein/diguanylate cyclase (GGDEF)-like protein